MATNFPTSLDTFGYTAAADKALPYDVVQRLMDATIALETLLITTNTIHNATFNDASSHNLGSVQNLSGRIIILVAGPANTVIPFYANAGVGVAFKWTVLDPDTGWLSNTNGTFSFTDGSALNTYSVSFSAGTGIVSIQRTAGTSSFRVVVVADFVPA